MEKQELPEKVSSARLTSTIARIARILRRLRRMSLRELVSMFRHARRLDFLVFYGDSEMLSALPPLGEEITIEVYTPSRRSGVRSIDDQLSRANHCYAVWIDGEIAHQSWLNSDATLLLQFGFDPRVPVITESSTLVKHRGKHLYPKTMRRIWRDIIEKGICDRVFLWVDPENSASIKGLERTGFKRLARIRGVKYGGLLFSREVVNLSGKEG